MVNFCVLIVIGVAFQIIGHQVFERRQPALLDNPTHLLLGPMFVMAKLYIALGFRRILPLLSNSFRNESLASLSAYTEERQGKSLPHS